MGEAHEKSSNESEKQPEFGAILPGNSGRDTGSFLQEFDNYQKKLDQEWETAKHSYQNKVDKIMEEYLHKKFDGPPPAPDPAPNKKEISESAQSFQERMEGLLARVEKGMKRSEKTSSFSIFDEIRPTIINVPSRSLKAFLKRVMTILIIAGSLAGLACYIFVFPLVLAAKTPLPYAHASSLLAKDGKLYLTDWFRKALFVHQLRRGLPIASVENIPNSFITGMTMSDKNLWTLDGFENKILRHTLTEDHQVLEKFPTPGPKPAGAFWDAGDLWTADNSTKLLYQHHLTDIETPFNQYQFPQMTVTSFLIENHRVWALDGETREVYVFRLQNPLKALATYDLDPYLNGAAPTGIALVGKDLLVSTIKPPQVIRIPLGGRGQVSPLPSRAQP